MARRARVISGSCPPNWARVHRQAAAPDGLREIGIHRFAQERAHAFPRGRGPGQDFLGALGAHPPVAGQRLGEQLPFAAECVVQAALADAGGVGELGRRGAGVPVHPELFHHPFHHAVGVEVPQPAHAGF